MKSKLWPSIPSTESDISVVKYLISIREIELNSNVECCQEVRRLVDDVRELVIAQLLIVVDIRLLQHLPPHLLGLLLGQLALGQQFESLRGTDRDI